MESQYTADKGKQRKRVLRLLDPPSDCPYELSSYLLHVFFRETNRSFQQIYTTIVVNIYIYIYIRICIYVCMCVCVYACVFNDLESSTLDLSRNAFRTRSSSIYFHFETKSILFFFLFFICGCRVYSVVVDEFI